ncbi:TonB-dependent receptor [Hymenobacter sp. GOD-10R]|uniref:TonB-dependent receptor n=1 Tax=Hymenobacter sp. GOD-10R TaxID=3093922 RepID=UPI002D794EEF|nr:TonB-dependent receptor [Hymenobacter sp. GOD-10R]WRQ29310.1 TonB-dependent receptor [Hymenobacter sp. GOD-10R]
MSAFSTYWRILISFLLLSIFGQLAQAQHGAIWGRVTAEGQALEFVSVVLVGTAVGATTDKGGHYQLASVAPGKHEVVFSFLGYDAQRLPVEIAAGQAVEVNVVLKPTTSKLGEVVVTGVSRTTEIRRSPVPIAVLGKREMNLNLSTNLIDAAVRGVPGLTAVTTGPNISKPFIRGLGYNRVLTLYNGLRQEGQQWGDEHGIEVDQYDIERIEVVKGPASLMYGSDAVAGVINMLPAHPSGPVGKLRGDIISEYHSNNGLIGTSLGLSYRQPAWQYAFRVSQKTAANYQNSIDGRVYGTAFRELNLSGMVGVDKAWGYSHWYATAYHNQQEIPDGSRDSLSRRFTKQVFEANLDDIKNRPLVTDDGLRSYSIGTLHQLIKHYRLFNRSQVKLGQHELSLLLGAQQNFRYEFNHPTAPKQAGLAVALTTYNYDLRDNLPTWQGVETTVGVNGMAQLNRNRDATDFPIPDYGLFDLGSYVFLKKSFGKLDLSGGARYDARRLTWDDFYVVPNPATGFDQRVSAQKAAGAEPQFLALNKWFRGVSGSLGATYSLSERLLVKANVARGYRAPNITEVGSNGLDPGAHIVYLGNRSFQPEFSLQQDLGLLAYLPDLDASVEVFHNNIQNYIYQAKLYDASGQPVVIVPGNTTYQYQQAAARLYGLEASLKLHPRAIKWLLFDNSLAFVNGLNQNQPLREQHGRAARYLPFMPPLRTRSELRATLAKPARWLAQTYVHVGVEAVATQNRFYAVDNTETATPGYALWSLGAGTSFVTNQAKPWLQLFVQLDNVFDKAYQSNLNRLKYFEYYAASPTGRLGIYNMGRNLSVKVVVPFGG